jgi:hypothetical protein
MKLFGRSVLKLFGWESSCVPIVARRSRKAKIKVGSAQHEISPKKQTKICGRPKILVVNKLNYEPGPNGVGVG